MLDWPAFGDALWRINDQLGIKPEWALPVLHLESAFNPAALNPRNCVDLKFCCVGLNQLCTGTYATYVRVPVAEYRTWLASKQLAGPVFAYWRDALTQGPIRSATRLMLAQLGQARLKSVPEPDNVVFRAPSLAYTNNIGLDVERDGQITERDLANAMARQAQLPAVANALARAYAMRPNERPGDAVYGEDYPLIVPPTLRVVARERILVTTVGVLALAVAAGYGISRMRSAPPIRRRRPAPTRIPPEFEFDYRSRL